PRRSPTRARRATPRAALPPRASTTAGALRRSPRRDLTPGALVSAPVGMSDYVRRLREKIGNDFMFMPSVSALIRDDDERILFVQHFEGRWQLPGGAVD